MTSSRSDYPDRIIAYKPAGRGGAGKRHPPAAKLTADGMLTLNHEAVELLGSPPRILMSVNPRQGRIYLRPATPGNYEGAYSLAGGGNSPHRISARSLIRDYPLLASAYRVGKSAEGIVLVIAEEALAGA